VQAEDSADAAATSRAALPAKAGRPDEAKLKSLKAKRPAGEPVAAGPEVDAGLLHDLHGSSEAAAVAAAQKLGAAESPRAVEALLDALSLGVSPKVAAAALDALGASKARLVGGGRPLVGDSLQVLALYAHHRNPELRKRATAALAALIAPPAEPPAAGAAAGKAPARPPAAPPSPPVAAAEAAQVVPMLITALSDSSADVRAVAAQALGDRREKSAEPALIKLLLRKDASAPAALGKIGGADTARALSEMIGNVPDSFITETLGLLLLRPDFGPDPLRLDVVKTLGKLPGSQPTDILSDYMNQTGKDKADKARPSRAEASKIVEQRTAK
jgi:HEAT repeat protein